MHQNLHIIYFLYLTFILFVSEFNFVAVEGKEVHSGNIEDVPTKEKSKFPQDFFPEVSYSYCHLSTSEIDVSLFDINFIVCV